MRECNIASSLMTAFVGREENAGNVPRSGFWVIEDGCASLVVGEVKLQNSLGWYSYHG